jgi:outer membrane protein assembly factor BamB
VRMRLVAAMVAIILVSGAGAGAATETMRYAITRNGEQIGTHEIEISRSGSETSVAVVTDLTVKVLFVTAYRLQHTENERWVNGQLVALNATSDNNGTRHTVSVSAKGSGLELKVDGKASLVGSNIMPASFWNPALLGRPLMLDTKDGQVMPVSVRDDGEEELTINDQVVKAHRYTINSRYSQDVWYDDQAHLVQAKLIASDGSVIMYSPL